MTEAKDNAKNDIPPPKAATTSADPARLKAERDDYLARLQRVTADFMNYQKRVQREVAEAREGATADLIREFLTVLDDMDRALEAAGKNHADDPVVEGMRLVRRKAADMLARHGLSPIPAAGLPFDPLKHRAVSQVPTDKARPHTVLDELQKGYALNGRTLRPSSVVVAVPPGKADEEIPDEPTDGLEASTSEPPKKDEED